MDPFSSIGNSFGAPAGGIGNSFGGGQQPQVGGAQSPKAILQALLAKLGITQGQNNAAPTGGGECSCGAGGGGGGQGGCSGGAAQRTEGLGF